MRTCSVTLVEHFISRFGTRARAHAPIAVPMSKRCVRACSPPKLPLKRKGKYVVCLKGTRQGFGVVSGVRKPDGITVHADGRCVFSEYAGGFDGFWSTDAGDGHEDGLALAAKRV